MAHIDSVEFQKADGMGKGTWERENEGAANASGWLHRNITAVRIF